MATWKTTFYISDVWNKKIGDEPWTNKTVHELGKEIAKRLKRKFAVQIEEDFDLEDIVYFMETISTEDDHLRSKVYLSPIEEFDEYMRQLYDWADYNRVWINK